MKILYNVVVILLFAMIFWGILLAATFAVYGEPLLAIISAMIAIFAIIGSIKA